MTEKIIVKHKYLKYVSQNILAMIGISAYIIADTFFIAKSQGGSGITALNLVLPVYSLIYAIGAMIGVGSAIRFTIFNKIDKDKSDTLFFHALCCTLIISLIFISIGILCPDKILYLLGADKKIAEIGTGYLRIVLIFSPCFMWNHVCNAFTRNDGQPSLSMTATLSSTIFNIVMDYILMFPFNMGMEGAALATALSPIVGVLICCTHLFSKKSNIKFCICPPSLKKLIWTCQLGISSFVSEISSGVTTAAFNVVILGLTGNIGVAAYGVVANTALVAVSVFNGISQGAQPLLSDYYGKKDLQSLKTVIKLTLITSSFFAVIIVLYVYITASYITKIFNSEGNKLLTTYAVTGLRIYFTGFIFAGFNIVGSGILSAIEKAKGAFITSISRGVIAILACTFTLPFILGMTGVWLAFPAAELITLIILLLIIKREKNNIIYI